MKTWIKFLQELFPGLTIDEIEKTLEPLRRSLLAEDSAKQTSGGRQ